MKYFILSFLMCSGLFAHIPSDESTKPQTKEEQQTVEDEWSEEAEEARQRQERERWILEERARGYEPTSKRYRPVMPRGKMLPIED